MLKTKDEDNVISHTLFMTKFNMYEGERNEERKFLKVNAYNYIHTLFVASEQDCLMYIKTEVHRSHNKIEKA